MITFAPIVVSMKKESFHDLFVKTLTKWRNKLATNIRFINPVIMSFCLLNH